MPWFLFLLNLELEPNDFLKRFYLFILWGEEQRERENPKQTPCEYKAWHEAQSQDPKITTWAEIKNRCLTNWATQAPQNSLL